MPTDKLFPTKQYDTIEQFLNWKVIAAVNHGSQG